MLNVSLLGAVLIIAGTIGTEMSIAKNIRKIQILPLARIDLSDDLLNHFDDCLVKLLIETKKETRDCG